MRPYLALIEQQGNSWGAYCLDLPGVGVVADNREDVERLIREAVELHIEELRSAGEPVPEPTTLGATRISVA